MSQDLSLTERLAHHLMRPIGEADRRRARLHLLDWLGCVLGARRSEVGQKLQRAAGDDPTVKAAWLGNVLEMDDVHRAAILHPGPVIWPSLAFGSDMEIILNDAVVGYEVMIAIGSTFDGLHYAYYHNTATAGIFGAAAALVGHNDKKKSRYVAAMASALGFAGSVSGGLWQMRHEPGAAKQWHVANAVSIGIRAVDAMQQNLQSPRFILEGPQGLYAATCDEPKPMEFTDHWRIHEVSIKSWGACRHAHPAIDAALELKAADGLNGDIRVETFADAITFCDRPDPKTPHEAKFSLQHAVAIVAERGVPQLADFEPDGIAALTEARSRVTVAEAPDITARYPGHFGARVATAAGSHELVDTLGDPERPLTDQGIEDKARALMAWGGLSDNEADEAVAAVFSATDSGAVIDVLERHL